MNTTQAPVKARSPSAPIPDTASRLRPPSRLFVVVPDVAEAALLAVRIHQMVDVGRHEVVLVGVASEMLLDAELRRRLTLVAAFLQDAGTIAQIRVEEEEGLVAALQAVLGDDDMLACCVVENSAGGALERIDRLASWFRRPVYAFLESAVMTVPKTSTTARLAPWVVSIVIILTFFWLQVRISASDPGAITTGLLMASVAVEIGLISLSNALVG